MKILLVGEIREGRLRESVGELAGFSAALGAEAAMVLVGDTTQLPLFDGTLYLADALRYGQYQPDLHKRLVLAAVEREEPDYIVLLHSSYGWDLAPRIAASLGVAQISDVIALADGAFEVGCCNAKMRRIVKPHTSKAVLTIQPGAFPVLQHHGLPPVVHSLATGTGMATSLQFSGYRGAGRQVVDLAGADVIVSAGRGVGKKEQMEIIRSLAAVLGAEIGASRPVVDAGWVEHSRQVGSTGQTVAPKLYVACGISGAIHHLAGMKQSGFILAVNKDRDAPIADVADLTVVADLMEFVPALVAKLAGRRNG